MKKAFVITVLLIITRTIGFTQSVGIGTTTPDASSVLELKATNKGFLPPRMTASEKGLIASPKAGLMIYQTDAPAGLYVYNGGAWEAVAGTATGFGWALNGNSGTNPSNNFIGTRDNQPLKFRVNNFAAGEINAVTANLAFGSYAFEKNTTGKQNTALGFNSLNNNTTGSDNTGVGIGALYFTTTGSANTAIGITALALNTKGNNNVAAGAFALNQNLTGWSNVAVGSSAAYQNIAGSNIVAIGDSSLYNNTGSYNIGVGSKALYFNTTGVSNTAIGSQSLYNNISGSQNTALGRIALYGNTTGIQNTALGHQAARYNQSGNSNTAVGFQSLLFNVDNNNNTAIGNGSLANTISDNNTGIGRSALSVNTTGYSNTALGFEALSTNTIGNNNTAVGYQAGVWGNNFVNATAIGANAQAGCSDCVVLGSVNGYNGATATSKVGIGTTSPQKALHVNPNGAGGMMIGNNITTGGYTVMNMGISQASGGYSYIQSVKSAWTNSTYGDLVFNLAGGNVGIRTANPLAQFHIKQHEDVYPINDAGIRIERAQNTNHWDMGVDFANDISYSYNGAAKFYFNSSDGSLYTVSDKRMKKDISSITNALPSIMKLEAKTYHYTDNPYNAQLAYGFIAQDVEKIFPDFVKTKGADGLKAVSYQNLNIIAIKAIQEQQVIIEAQQKQIDLHTQQNVLMMETIKKLEKAIEEIRQAKK